MKIARDKTRKVTVPPRRIGERLDIDGAEHVYVGTNIDGDHLLAPCGPARKTPPLRSPMVRIRSPKAPSSRIEGRLGLWSRPAAIGR